MKRPRAGDRRATESPRAPTPCLSNLRTAVSYDRRARSSAITRWCRAPRLGRVYGYAGPAGSKAAEVLSKYIIVDMYAKAVQGMPAEDAVKWAEGEVRKVYG